MWGYTAPQAYYMRVSHPRRRPIDSARHCKPPSVSIQVTRGLLRKRHSYINHSAEMAADLGTIKRTTVAKGMTNKCRQTGLRMAQNNGSSEVAITDAGRVVDLRIIVTKPTASPTKEALRGQLSKWALPGRQRYYTCCEALTYLYVGSVRIKR